MNKRDIKWCQKQYTLAHKMYGPGWTDIYIPIPFKLFKALLKLANILPEVKK